MRLINNFQIISFTRVTLYTIHELHSTQYTSYILHNTRVTLYTIYELHSTQYTSYTLQQGSPTFCGRWAKKWENYKPFLLGAINSYFLLIFSNFFLVVTFFFGPQNLKRAFIFFEKGHIWSTGHRLAIPTLHNTRVTLYTIHELHSTQYTNYTLNNTQVTQYTIHEFLNFHIITNTNHI